MRLVAVLKYLPHKFTLKSSKSSDIIKTQQLQIMIKLALLVPMNVLCSPAIK